MPLPCDLSCVLSLSEYPIMPTTDPDTLLNAYSEPYSVFFSASEGFFSSFIPL